MRKLLNIISIMLLTLPAFSQKAKVNHLTTFDDKLIHFGFTLGLNTLDFSVAHYNPIGNNPAFADSDFSGWLSGEQQIGASDYVRAGVARLIPGFTVGIISSLRLSNDLDLRFLPGISFGERLLYYNIPVYDTDRINPQPFYSVKSTFLDFPLLIKYKARRINNDRPFVIFGGAYREDISRTGKDDLVRLNNGSFYAEIGGGWDHYFTFFRFSVEAKFSFGLNNIISGPPTENQRQFYSHAIKELRSDIFTLSFHFE
ncbi:MAG: PorT family protein [Bacteroidales bacterium]|nr:PorT family protein [Bacteroidales bacterium]